MIATALPKPRLRFLYSSPALLALGLFTALHGGEAAAAERPKANDLSLSFGIPSGGNGYASGAAGLWWLASERLNVGFNVGLGLNFDTNEVYDLLLAPAARLYLTTGDRISPFILGQVNLRLFEAQSEADVNLAFVGGLGAELWFMRELSLSGYVGLGIDAYQGRGSSARIGTLTSGLTLNFYWGSS